MHEKIKWESAYKKNFKKKKASWEKEKRKNNDTPFLFLWIQSSDNENIQTIREKKSMHATGIRKIIYKNVTKKK